VKVEERRAVGWSGVGPNCRKSGCEAGVGALCPRPGLLSCCSAAAVVVARVELRRLHSQLHGISAPHRTKMERQQRARGRFINWKKGGDLSF
jgi:hypothetical protein